MLLQPATSLGPYSVTAKIGEGGMAEVWQARDTKLDRDVALKVPEAFTADPDELLHCRQLGAGDLVTRTVAQGYLDFIGLRPQQLFMNNPRDLRRLMGRRTQDIENIKHGAAAIDHLHPAGVKARGPSQGTR